MIRCPQCERLNNDHVLNCNRCGARLPDAERGAHKIGVPPGEIVTQAPDGSRSEGTHRATTKRRHK